MLALSNPMTFADHIKTNLTHHGSFGGDVQAYRERNGESVCFVTYVAVGCDFVITSYGVSRGTTERDARAGGDEIDHILEQEAQRLGIKRLLIVYANCDRAEVIRSYALQPFTMRRFDNPHPHQYLN